MPSDCANLYLKGISFKSATPSQIGSCSLPSENILAAESEILRGGRISEILFLMTCNRAEIYFVSASDRAFADIAEVLKKYGADSETFDSLSYSASGSAAVAHIFKVASGLCSQMVGETEILGQVKAAYARSLGAGHCKAILNATFQKAVQCAKLIRTDTEIGHGKISVGSVAADLALRIFPDLRKVSILLVGSGEAGRLVAEALSIRGARNIYVSSRTFKNAQSLAGEIGAFSLEMSEVPARMADFDVVICASSARRLVVSAELARRTIKARGEKPVFFVDLGVPPNVDPAVESVDGAFLYNLEDLSKIASENLNIRKGEIARASQTASERAEALARRLGFA